MEKTMRTIDIARLKKCMKPMREFAHDVRMDIDLNYEDRLFIYRFWDLEKSLRDLFNRYGIDWRDLLDE